MRLIVADALVKEIKRVYCTGCNDYHGIRCKACATDDALDMVEDAPTIDAEPVRHGRWIDRGDYITTAYGSLDLKICSCCNAEVTLDGYDYYCPNCGAKMRGDDGASE